MRPFLLLLVLLVPRVLLASPITYDVATTVGDCVGLIPCNNAWAGASLIGTLIVDLETPDALLYAFHLLPRGGFLFDVTSTPAVGERGEWQRRATITETPDAVALWIQQYNVVTLDLYQLTLAFDEESVTGEIYRASSGLTLRNPILAGQVTPISEAPEPATLLLVGSGLFLLRRKCRR